VQSYTKYKPLEPKRERPSSLLIALLIVTAALFAWVWWPDKADQSESASKRLALQTNSALVSRETQTTRTNEIPVPSVERQSASTAESQRSTNPSLAPAEAKRGGNLGENQRRDPIPSTIKDSAVQQSPSPGTNAAALTPATNRPAIVPFVARVPRSIYEAQIALGRRGFSSGSLDGAMGSQTRAALRAFQEREQLAITGDLDAATKARLLLSEPPEKTRVINTNDLARLLPVGTTWFAKSQQPRLDYENVLELLAEESHAHPNLVRMLNPSVEWTNINPGIAVVLPNVQSPVIRGKAAFVRVRLSEKNIRAWDSSSNLLAHFPCSIARSVEKRPVGQLMVEKVAVNPNYRFDPEVFPESAEGRSLKRKLLIPPGPNNPVGTAWIGLNRPGYGIHGTPRPEDVGRTESHGCFRLANWNAEYLAQLVRVGTPVVVEP
jgi:lipoprotein-anchoring transpeptidase ErfK/SrfK